MYGKHISIRQSMRFSQFHYFLGQLHNESPPLLLNIILDNATIFYHQFSNTFMQLISAKTPFVRFYWHANDE